VTEDQLISRLDAVIARMDERDARMEERDARMEARLARIDSSFELMAKAFERLVRNEAKRDQILADMRDQLAANTQAVLRVLDRLGPAPG